MPTVSIRCEETLRFHRTVEMTDEEFEEFENTVKQLQRFPQSGDVTDIWLDPHDPDHSDGPEEIEYEVITEAAAREDNDAKHN